MTTCTKTQINAHPCFLHVRPLSSSSLFSLVGFFFWFFFGFDFKYPPSSRPSLFPTKVFWPTHNWAQKWVTTFGMPTPKYLTLFTLGVFTYVNLSSFPCLPFTYTLSGAPAALIGDTDTRLLHLLFLQICLFCCNVYSYSPPVSTQLCVNVTLPQSFLSGAVNWEFDQLCCQWNITQIQHNNKS